MAVKRIVKIDAKVRMSSVYSGGDGASKEIQIDTPEGEDITFHTDTYSQFTVSRADLLEALNARAISQIPQIRGGGLIKAQQDFASTIPLNGRPE